MNENNNNDLELNEFINFGIQVFLDFCSNMLHLFILKRNQIENNTVSRYIHLIVKTYFAFLEIISIDCKIISKGKVWNN